MSTTTPTKEVNVIQEPDLGTLIKEIEKYSGKYEFSPQFWGMGNNNIFISKNDVEIFSGGGYENISECLKSALEYIYKINRTPKDQRVF